MPLRRSPKWRQDRGARRFPAGIDGRPSTRPADAWFSQEKREPAPFLCTYMDREKDDGNSFRFFWNKSRATSANVHLLLYPRGEVKAALAARPELYPIMLARLRVLTGEHLIKEGRVYGGGLHKMEPKELADLPAVALTRLIQARLAPKQRHLTI